MNDKGKIVSEDFIETGMPEEIWINEGCEYWYKNEYWTMDDPQPEPYRLKSTVDAEREALEKERDKFRDICLKQGEKLADGLHIIDLDAGYKKTIRELAGKLKYIAAQCDRAFADGDLLTLKVIRDNAKQALANNATHIAEAQEDKG